MPRKPKQQSAMSEYGSPETSTYRGRTIEVRRAASGIKNAGPLPISLRIDGEEISIEQTELGYISHDSMFKLFGSPHELAEHLIRDFGEAPVRSEMHMLTGDTHHDGGMHGTRTQGNASKKKPRAKRMRS